MDAFQALADPTRRSILTMLARGERSAGEIGAEFEMTAPAVSQHLKALRLAGLVHVRGEAQKRIYRLNTEGLDRVDAWLSRMRPARSRHRTMPRRLPLSVFVQARRLGTPVV